MTSLYKRWAPPKKDATIPQPKSSPSLTRPRESHQIDTSTRRSGEDGEAKEQANRNKIEKSNSIAETPRHHWNADLKDGQQAVPKQPKKLKKRKRETEHGQEASRDDEATPKKFKSIYSKFEHSMKLSAQESANKDLAPPEPAQPVEEQLHGEDLLF